MADYSSETMQVADVLRSATRVAVGSHVDPDGDAIGSTLGLCLALRSIGIDATPVLPGTGPAPRTYSFLPLHDEYVAAADLTTPDVFVALDTPTFARLGETEDLARQAAHLVVIDHHPDNGDFGTASFVDAEACSVGSMIWRLLPDLGVTPDARIATCLYTALVTDTGRLSYSNTTPQALRTAADMVACGVDVADVYTHVYESRSSGALALVGRVLQRVTVIDAGAIAYSWVDDADYAETGALIAEGENLIDEVRALGGARIVFLLKRSDGHIRVSLRAKTGADVASVARSFGGGGHTVAAGFRFEGETEDLLADLLPALQERLR